MLTGRGGNAEGLFHEAIGFVSIALVFSIIMVFIASPTRIGRFPCTAPCSAEPITAFAFHFAVRQKTPRNAAGAP